MTKQTSQVAMEKQTDYHFQKLTFCKKCDRYSVLKEKRCPVCNCRMASIKKVVKSIFFKRLVTVPIGIFIVISLGILFAPTIGNLYYSLVTGLIFCIIYMLLSLLFIKSECFHLLKRLLRSDLGKIQAGLQFDLELAKRDAKEKRYALAYEKYSEMAEIIYSDRMKIHRIKMLNEMEFRSSMACELESLMPASYDKDFVKYALKMLNINRTLVTKKCIAYLIHYRDAIVIDFGMDSLMAIAGTTLRMKLYIQEFSAFIEEYLDYLPKDRLLRLCRMIQANQKDDWGSLKEKITRLVARKYHNDPDFKRFVFEKERARSHA